MNRPSRPVSGTHSARLSHFERAPSGRFSWLVSALLLAGFAGHEASAQEPLSDVRDRDWDRAFTRTKGWTGADGAYSVDLEGRTLWLYSDTWVGTVAKGKHAPGSRLVNNTIGVHTTPARGSPPKPESLRFRWGPKTDEGHPSAWIIPDPARVPLQGPDKDAKSWYWILDGEVVRVRRDRRRLVFFLAHIGKRPNATGVWSFESVGGAIAIVDNHDDDPARWRIEQHPLPHAIGRRDPRTKKGAVPTSWGAAVWADRDPRREADLLYIWGIRETAPLDKKLLIARVDAASTENPSSWRFFDGKSWSSTPGDARPIAGGLVNELSVDQVEHAGKSRFVMVHSEPVFGPRIFVRTARSPEGPWSDRRAVHHITGLDAKAQHFPYAAKGHAHLSRAGELLITYVVNSHDFWKMVGDASIYRPRFVRVPLTAVLAD